MTPLVAAIIGLIVVVLILVVVSRSRRSGDGVDSFRRQIDALSPEARRPVIDQMYDTSDRSEPRIEPWIDPRPLGEDASGAQVESVNGDAGDRDAGDRDVGDRVADDGDADDGDDAHGA